MKKSLIKIKPFIKYFFIFFFFLFWNLIVQPINLDEIWNYGFIYNIYNGLTPYKDFNMVLTPFYPFIMSLPMYIFGSNMLVVHIINCLMICFMFFLIERLFNKKINLLIFILLLCLPLSVTFPSYNLFLLLLFIVVIYMEKYEYNDYLIGILLGLFILTKQSVGVCLCLPSIYYLFKDRSKFIKRVVGALSPCVIFVFYLLFSGCFKQFFDLCLFGLFDFASTNSSEFNIMFIISILLFISNIILIIKNKNNLFYYYLLSFFSILIPLFDLYHLKLYVFSFLLIFLLNNNFEFKNRFINTKLFIWGISIGFAFLIIIDRFEDDICFPNNINNFEYRAVEKEYLDYTNKINKVFLKYKSKYDDVIFLSADGYYFKLINDMDISYIDLINSGNWGYNGSLKLLNYIKSCDNVVFFLDVDEVGDGKQTDQKALKYVIDNGKVIDEVEFYKVYTLKENADE